MNRYVSCVALALLLLPLGCAPSDEALEPYLCLEALHLKELITLEGLPETHDDIWTVAASYETMKNTVFNGEQQTEITLSDPAGFVDNLCQHLRSTLSQRCEVTTFRQGEGYCAATLRSPMQAITSPTGVYTARAMEGRISLLASQRPNGQTQLVLQSTEWRD